MSYTDATTFQTAGTRGHTRTTWDHGLRALFRRLRLENPRATKRELQELYMSEYREDDDLKEEAGARAFGHDYASWLTQRDVDPQPQQHSAPARQPRPVRHQPQQPQHARQPRQRLASADVASEAASLVERARTVILLDLVEANGKRLGDCTAGELRALGGWRIKIADRIGDDSAIVRERISEAATREILDGDSSTGR